MRGREHKKNRKIFINQLINIIENSTEYQEYIQSDDRYRNWIETNSLLKVWGYTILDTYNNRYMNKLIKRFSKLNNDVYEVKLNYRPKKFRDLNYLTLQYSGTRVSSLATIKFLNDKYISEISTSFTQVNNNQAVVEYKISFNKVMDQTMFLDFIKMNKEALYNKVYIGYYNLENIIETMGYSDIYRMFDELIGLTVQSKICEIAELNYGLKYKLPSMRVINYPQEAFDKEYFKDVFLRETYEINNGEQYLITDITGSEGLEMELYFSGKYYSPLTFTDIISNYRMDFYYFLFDGIEQNELNARMNKYFNESKENISSNDYKWIVNKIRAINDNKLHLDYDKSMNKVKDWKAFYGGEEKDLYFTNRKYINKYQTIYSECLEHIRILYAVGKENLIIKLSLMTLVATILGIFTTVLLTFI